MRRLLFLLVCAGMSLVGLPAGVAMAAPTDAPVVTKVTSSRSHVPSAPRRLAGEPTGARSVRVSWHRPAEAGSSPVRHYRVRVTLVPGHHRAHARTVSAGTRSTTFSRLKPGRTYRVSVRAVSHAGRGPAARIRYTVPQRAGSWVFAVDTATQSIVRVPVAGGPVTTVAPHRGAWTVDPAGDVYSVDVTAGTLTRTPADGSTPTVIARGLTEPGDVQLDAAGRVYVVGGTGVIRMTATGADPTVIVPAAEEQVFVAPDGTVSTVSSGDDLNLDVVTYPSGGGPVVRRTVDIGSYYYGGPGSLLGDDAGTLFVHAISTGGGGDEYWYRLASGSSTRTSLTTRQAYVAAAVDPNGAFHLIQTVGYCDWETMSDPESHCTPDPPDQSVDETLNYALDGTRTSTPLDPFTFDRIHRAGIHVLAVDGQGRTFVAQPVGPSKGILEYAATGGTATVLATGSYEDPKRNN